MTMTRTSARIRLSVYGGEGVVNSFFADERYGHFVRRMPRGTDKENKKFHQRPYFKMAEGEYILGIRPLYSVDMGI